MEYHVTFPGNARLQSTFGGATYHLIDAIKSIGGSVNGLPLRSSESFLFERYVWNFLQFLRNGYYGGFQYSDLFLNKNWNFVKNHIRTGDVVINMFQLYSDSLFYNKGVKKVFYIDQTLYQLFDGYPEFRHLSVRAKELIINKERRQYELADLMICMCDWARVDLIERYGLNEDKIQVVHPGANVDVLGCSKVSRRLIGEYDFDMPGVIRFLFIGKDYERKGLLRFLGAMRVLNSGDILHNIELHVIGVSMDMVPIEFRDIKGVFWHGFIDKSKEFDKFCDIVFNCQVGVLLSRAEATGLSLREFQLFGLAVLAPNVGGAPEMLANGAGILVDEACDDAAIAKIVVDNFLSVEHLRAMRTAVLASRDEMTWVSSARKVLSLCDSI